MISERRDHDEGGLLYAGRRKFLVSSGKNSLEPPTRFLTRGQAHKKAVFEKINERDSGTQPKFKFDILTQVKSKESKRDKKNLNAHADDTIVIEKFSSTSRRDWREQTRAGNISRMMGQFFILSADVLFFQVLRSGRIKTQEKSAQNVRIMSALNLNLPRMRMKIMIFLMLGVVFVSIQAKSLVQVVWYMMTAKSTIYLQCLTMKRRNLHRPHRNNKSELTFVIFDLSEGLFEPRTESPRCIL